MISTRSTVLLPELPRTVQPPADADWKWKGVSHAELAEEFERQMSRRWCFSPFAGFLCRDAVAMAGGWSSVGCRVELTGIVPCLGIVNSNDSHVHGGMIRTYAGLRIGDRSVVLEELSLGRHTSGFDLPSAVTWALAEASQCWAKSPRTVERLRSQKITTSKAWEILGQAGEKRLLPFSRVGRAKRDFCDGQPASAWGLLLAFAGEARNGPPMTQMANLWNFYEML